MNEIPKEDLELNAAGAVKVYPAEVRLRALMLICDGHSKTDIAAHLGIDRNTIEKWNKKGIEMHGIAFSFREVRDLTDPDRAIMQANGDKKTQDWWLEYTSGFDEDAARDLKALRKLIVEAAMSGEVELKAADIPKLIEKELLVQGRATKITEQSKNLTLIVAGIVREAAEKAITSPRERELFLDMTKQGFYRLAADDLNDKELAKRAGG